MKTQILAVRDQKTNNFTQPVTAPTIGSAIRSWGDQLNDPDNQKSDQAKHPEDFALWHLGEYDDNTGEITAIKPVQVALASNLMRNTQ